jgi:hypothetical protein
VERAYAVFTELDKNGVHKLANLAVERISWGLNELKRMQDNAQHGDRENPVAANRVVQQTVDSEMQGAAGSEARPYATAMHDTVMGNTGMLLLEDPGLQSFVREAFSPFTWVMAGAELEGVSTMAAKQKEHQEPQTQCDSSSEANVEHETMGDVERSSQTARSSEQPHGVQGSTVGLSQSRYTTLSPVATQQTQTQGLTSSSASSVYTPSGRQQNEARVLPGGIEQIHQPPHLRHHSYPLPRHQVPSPLALHPPYTSTSAHGVPNTNSNHMSHYFVSSHSPLQTLSEMTTQSPGVHPSWAARPAAPILGGSEPSLSFSHVSSSEQGIHGIAPQNVSSAYQY